MKYFKYELWINDNKAEWSKNDEEYTAYFEKIKDSFTDDFLEIYCAEHGFHDREINKILLTDSNTLLIELTNRKSGFIKIEYKGVTALNINNIDNVNKLAQIGHLLEWGYDEFNKKSETELIHSILTSCGIELEITFESISAFYSEKTQKSNGTPFYL